MATIHIQKDHALKWQLIFWGIIAVLYTIAVRSSHPSSPYILTALIGSIYYIISRLVFGKHKIWQNFLSALILVLFIDCILPIFFGGVDSNPFYLFINHTPVIIAMFFIDFFVEETLEVIEEVDERLEHIDSNS